MTVAKLPRLERACPGDVPSLPRASVAAPHARPAGHARDEGRARVTPIGAPADTELLRRVAEGDARAVGALYDRYAPVVWPLALRILRDRAEAEDLLHDAFLVIAERAAQYAPERGTVAAWIVIVVRNLSIDRARRRARRGALVRELVPHEPTERPRDPESLTARAADGATVRRALAELGDAHRATLEAAFFEGLSYAEIAERDGLPLGTVKSRAARALAALRASLERRAPAEPRKRTASPRAA